MQAALNDAGAAILFGIFAPFAFGIPVMLICNAIAAYRERKRKRSRQHFTLHIRGPKPVPPTRYRPRY